MCLSQEMRLVIARDLEGEGKGAENGYGRNKRRDERNSEEKDERWEERQGIRRRSQRQREKKIKPGETNNITMNQKDAT